MPADYLIGDNYELSEDTSGNLVITHTPSGSELRFTDGGLQFELNAPLKVTDLIDGAGVSHTGELADNDHGTLDGLGDDDHTQYLLVDGTRSMSGVLDAAGIDNPDYNEPVDTATAVSGTLDFDLSTSNWFERELDGDITIAFSNISSSPPGNSVTIYLEDTDGTGPHTITYPSGTIWPNGNVRDTVDSNGSLEIVMTSPDGGTTWRASRRGADWA
jgi:hypothetical protein